MLSELFESVGDVWIIWALALLLVGYCSRRVISKFSVASFKRFHAGEEGASYALPYVLTFPFFVLLMAVFIQATLILLCKIGNVNAAYAATRSYAVWRSTEEDNMSAKSEKKLLLPKFYAIRAASMAMAPFASSRTEHFKTIPLETIKSGVYLTPSGIAAMAADGVIYTMMYNRLQQNAHQKDSSAHKVISDPSAKANKSYIVKKYAYSVAATKLTFLEPKGGVKWNEDITVKVRYRMPFHIPGTSRIFGGKRSFIGYVIGGGRYRDIETTVTIPSEAAKTENGLVGIPYDPKHLMPYDK